MYWEKTTHSFFTIENSQPSVTAIKTGNPNMARIRIRMDQKKVVYGRVAETIFNGLESIGGFYESIMHIGFMLVFFF
jgi:hypothetical protein